MNSEFYAIREGKLLFLCVLSFSFVSRDARYTRISNDLRRRLRGVLFYQGIPLYAKHLSDGRSGIAAAAACLSTFVTPLQFLGVLVLALLAKRAVPL